MHVTRLVAATIAAVGLRRPELTTAFDALELSYGWTRSTFPSQSDLADIARGRGILEEGPYVARALALLDARLDDEGRVVPQKRPRMQALLEYVEEPEPLDAWKAVTGTDPGSPRLSHLLQARALQIGLVPVKKLPDTILASAGNDPEKRARAFLALIG